MRRAGAVGALVALTLVTQCGARTELAFEPAPEPALGASFDAGFPEDAAAVPCITGDLPLVKADPALLFLLDRSRSMAERIGPAAPTRWGALTEALASTLPAVDSTMNIGALLFPSAGGSDQCAIPGAADIAPGKNHVAQLLRAMRSSVPAGGTPTADALEIAARQINAFRAASAARALVLATDGAPVCNAALNPNACRCVGGFACPDGLRCLDDVRTVERIRALATRGLPTYVIGIGGEDFGETLDAMAVVGGRPRASSPRYYPASSSAELAAALTEIRDRIGGCTFLTSSVPNDQGSITVTVGAAELPFDPSGRVGWHWNDKRNGEIELSADACRGAPFGAEAALVAHVTCSADGGIVDASRADVADATRDGRRD